MTDEELTAKYKAFAQPGGPLHGLFEVEGVKPVAYLVDGLKGHPFTVGPEHVEYASDHCGGVLGPEVCERIPCAHQDRRLGPKCGRPYSAHTTERGLFVFLVRDLGNEEAARAMKAVVNEMEKDGITGFALPNLGKPYKIAKPEGK